VKNHDKAAINARKPCNVSRYVSLVIKAGELKQSNTQRNFRLKVKVPITTFNEAELRSK